MSEPPWDRDEQLIDDIIITDMTPAHNNNTTDMTSVDMTFARNNSNTIPVAGNNSTTSVAGNNNTTAVASNNNRTFVINRAGPSREICWRPDASYK